MRYLVVVMLALLSNVADAETMKWKGATYTGEISSRVPHGQGALTFPDGRNYVGEFKDGNFNGQGTFSWPNGDKQVGEFKDGKQHGQGTLTKADGRNYVGEFKDGNFNGQGALTRPKGPNYVGEFKDNYENGQGTLTTFSGWSVAGLFSYNRGQGTTVSGATLRSPNGVIYWEGAADNLFKTGLDVSGDGIYLGSTFNSLPLGYGVFTDTLGQKWQGHWVLGEWHGEGALFDGLGSLIRRGWWCKSKESDGPCPD